MNCNCENNLCASHPTGACKAPAGKARMMYVGTCCDGCADAIDTRYLLIDKSGANVPRLRIRPINWNNFDAYNGVDDR